uniref:Peptidase A1 domain-containing protein n=1 Tax=Arundo donax TaxID=35708 RepID=A0A0A9BXT3_ARUDO
MALPLQALSILHHLVLAASMLVVMVGSAEQPSGYRFPLIRRSASATMRYSDFEYHMEFKIGDSLVSAIVDTGSDLTWTNNSLLIDSPVSCPCDIAKENMYCCREVCMYKINYGDTSVARGFMAKASLTFGETTHESIIGSAIIFDCHSQTGNNKGNCNLYRDGGVVGLGRGELSLVKQLGLQNFSYCLTDYHEPNQISHIVLGLPDLVVLPTEDRKKTKLMDIEGQLSRYYVELTKISMDHQVLDIPKTCFELNKANGHGGMFIDSGSTYTRLPTDAFSKVKEKVTGRMNQEPKNKNITSNAGFTCYHGKKIPDNMPKMELHFAGGAQMVLPIENYMVLDQKYEEVCLTVKDAHPLHPHTFILGNFQQQNIDMFFDITHKELSFVERKCGENKHAAV